MNDLVTKYDRRVARYTSYPTAPHFHAGVNGATYREWLEALPADAPLSLYVHIPYCGVLCWYCGCEARVINKYGPMSRYLGHLRQELALLADVLGPGRPLVNLHWGGGTPNMLSPEDTVRLAEDLKSHFVMAPDAEFSVEIDPRMLEPEKIRGFAEAGVTRVSFGVQDFAADVQAAINRIQPYDMTQRAVEGFREAGIANVNFDLLYGLPCQTLAGVKESADLAMTLAPDRIALFGYAHVPWMRRHQNLIDEATLPGAHDRLRFAEAAAERIRGHGMIAIGLDHFARPDDRLAVAQREGRLHRNFQGYTDDAAPALIGLGVSAIGSLPQGYVQNAHDVRGWQEAVEEGRLPVVRGFAVDDDDRLRRSVIERLMCDLEVDLAAQCAAYGRAPDSLDDALGALAEMEADGLVERRGRVVRITERGRPWMRIACAAFDAYFAEGGAPRHARAV